MKGKKIYIVCPVRKLTEPEKKEIDAYVSDLEKKGFEVRCPYRDTDQNEEIGYRITVEHVDDVRWADEYHIWWNTASSGSHVDAGQIFMEIFPASGKKVVLINADRLEVTCYGGCTKSYTNVLLAVHYGLPQDVTYEELKKVHARRKGK